VQRCKEGVDPGKAPAEYAQRNSNRRGKRKSSDNSLQARQCISSQRVVEPEFVQLRLGKRLGGAGQGSGWDDSIFAPLARRKNVPDSKNDQDARQTQQRRLPLRHRPPERKETSIGASR